MARLVIVTGGNRGLGLETSRLFVSNGDKVVLASRQQEAGIAAARKIESETDAHSAVAVATLDIADSQSIDQFTELMKEDYDQQIDILVNNAGILEHGWSQEIFDRAIAVNVKGQIDLTEKMAPLMRQGGRIVMVSSVLALNVPPGSTYRRLDDAASIEDVLSVRFVPNDVIGNAHAPTYSLSKMMLNKAAKFLSTSEMLMKKEISVDCVHPGWCRTDMGTDRAIESAEEGATRIFDVANKDPPTNGKFYLGDETRNL